MYAIYFSVFCFLIIDNIAHRSSVFSVIKFVFLLSILLIYDKGLASTGVLVVCLDLVCTWVMSHLIDSSQLL